MSLISIIIPTYNSSKTILATLASIKDQDFDDYEVLIMDGESHDNTLEVIRGIDNPKIKIFSQSDSGVYDAMNKGILYSEGKWLYFLGSDDELYDNNVLSSIAELTQNNEFNFIYGNCYYKNSKITYDGEFDFIKLLDRNICHQGIFYKKAFLQKIGKYNLKYKILADYDFNIRCYIHPDFKPIYTKKNIAVYNDGVGLSGNIDDPEFNNYSELLKKISYHAILNEKKRFFKNFGIFATPIELIYNGISKFKRKLNEKIIATYRYHKYYKKQNL